MRKTIDSHIATTEALGQRITRLRTIPAVGEKTAKRMAAILSTNSFTSAKEAAAFLGLVPESGRSVRGRSRPSKAGNSRVRASLYMTLWSQRRSTLTSRPCTTGFAHKARS